jgi:hypothetical protein
MRDWMGINGSSLANPPEEKANPIRREGAGRRGCAAVPSLSASARERMLSIRGEPLFFANWERTLMIHFEVEPAALQKVVPFPLELKDGRAFVSGVAFTLARMRPRFGGRFAAWLLKPISTDDFLNVRTYVRVNGETGIYFLAEWLSNRLSTILGPRAFGLPYRFGKIEYNHNWESFKSSSSSERIVVDAPPALTGRVTDAKTGNIFGYEAELNAKAQFRECEHSSISEWLMERYTAFTNFGKKRRFFRVWHQPWPQTAVDVCVTEKSLLDQNWAFFRDARLLGSNFSPGVTDVWMGRPHRVLC